MEALPLISDVPPHSSYAHLSAVEASPMILQLLLLLLRLLPDVCEFGAHTRRLADAHK